MYFGLLFHSIFISRKCQWLVGTIVTKWLFDQCTAERSYLIKIQDIFKKILIVNRKLLLKY
jgi:hypothetical protein